ncbi:hypothetical protein ACQR16_32130 [Bradyrhizobium oligotrophicum]|uniref:hypothetical protein n=1 Tax=Bradyrhizobium oligotrophicum TaxID=44255 RepID=UPI003EBBB8A8
MANERLPNERYPDGMNRPDMSTHPDSTGAGMTGTEYERTPPLDSRLQPDLEPTTAPSSTGRIAAYALGIALLLGAVFYGLNNMSVRNDQATTTPTSQSASNPNGSTSNSSPGVTTGAAGDRTTPPAAPNGPTNNAK